MLDIIFTIVMMLLLFGITIFVHEWGHFFVARKCGLVVKAFSIGMGPALWKKEVDGVTYKIGVFPIGGYVSLPQLDPEGMEKIQGDNEEDRSAPIPEITPWKKIAVSVAGPLCNIIFGIFLAWVIFLSSDLPTMEEARPSIGYIDEASEAYQKGLRLGDTILSINGVEVANWTEFMVEGLLAGDKTGAIDLKVENEGTVRTIEQIPVAEDPEAVGGIIEGVEQAMPCILGSISKDSPADAAGLKAHDIVQDFNGIAVRDWTHFTDLIQSTSNQTVSISVARGNDVVDLKITPTYNEEYDQIMVGVGLGYSKQTPMAQIKNDAFMIFRVLKGLVTPAESKTVAKNLQGPIGIFKILYNALQVGFLSALWFVRFININLAVLNLLPIPVLDGGHICFSLWEGITKRKVPPQVVMSLVNVFAILLIGAMIFLSWRDAGGNKLIQKFMKDDPAVEQVEEIPNE